MLNKQRVTSLEFLDRLVWLDGEPLLDYVQPYRRKLFTQALDTFDRKGRPRYSMVLSGRAKKNWKSTDLILAALFVLMIRRSPQGSDGLILANDADQAGDDLRLAKRLVQINPDLAAEIEVYANELRLRDGTATLKILPAKDIAGAHGKSAAIVCFDEIHSYKDWSLLEALSPDPTRDCLTWITSYASLYNKAGAPLFDLMRIGKSGKDKRMLFSWYSGDFCTDRAFAKRPPEQRANPSMSSWPDGAGYLEQQRARLPTGRFRRLHLNLPGSPEGAAFDQDMILKCVVIGRECLAWQEGIRYFATVDMSGGSSDDSVLCIFHIDGKTVVIDQIVKQMGEPPFSPRSAVSRFCYILKDWHISKVYGDAYGGQTFRRDFETLNVTYEVRTTSTSDLYERFEPLLNQREIELLDHPTTIEQAVGLIWKGNRITHENNSYDDHINAVALAAAVAREQMTDGELFIPPPGLCIMGEPRNVPNSVFANDAYPGVHQGSPMKPSRNEPWFQFYGPSLY